MDPNLVFASGVLIPQKIAGFSYFRDLPNYYPEQTTLFPPVSLLGSVQLRAQELADRIAKKFPNGLNGLAERGRVLSLSTISTPHHGSPIADLLLGHPLGLEFPFKDFWAQFANANAHALVDLTTAGAPGFKEIDPVPGIRYFAYAGRGLVSALLFAAHVYIETCEGENDGLVSVTSATWPENLAENAWDDADHFAEIGYDLNRPDLMTTFDFRNAIARVVQRAVT